MAGVAMIGWAVGWLMGERRGRRQGQRETEEAFLEAQAERQRLRAPEPGLEALPPITPPSGFIYRRRSTSSEFASLPLSFWITAVILITLAITVNAWILLIGLLVYGAIKAFTADSR